MNFYDKIKKLAEKNDIMLFVDMDGVMASYEVGKPYDFANKRPMMQNINNIKSVQEIGNVELHVLSICHKDSQIAEKNKWLDQYASFFAPVNRNILSKETFQKTSSKELKANFLKQVKTDKQIVLVDDDNMVLKYIYEKLDHIILFQDSELVD